VEEGVTMKKTKIMVSGGDGRELKVKDIIPEAETIEGLERFKDLLEGRGLRKGCYKGFKEKVRHTDCLGNKRA